MTAITLQSAQGWGGERKKWGKSSQSEAGPGWPCDCSETVKLTSRTKGRKIKKRWREREMGGRKRDIRSKSGSTSSFIILNTITPNRSLNRQWLDGRLVSYGQLWGMHVAGSYPTLLVCFAFNISFVDWRAVWMSIEPNGRLNSLILKWMSLWCVAYADGKGELLKYFSS